MLCWWCSSTSHDQLRLQPPLDNLTDNLLQNNQNNLKLCPPIDRELTLETLISTTRFTKWQIQVNVNFYPTIKFGICGNPTLRTPCIIITGNKRKKMAQNYLEEMTVRGTNWSHKMALSGNIAPAIVTTINHLSSDKNNYGCEVYD